MDVLCQHLLGACHQQHVNHVNYQPDAEKSEHLHGWLQHLCKDPWGCTKAKWDTVELVCLSLHLEEKQVEMMAGCCTLLSLTEELREQTSLLPAFSANTY